MLFENFTPQTSVLLKQLITETIDNFEPRAAVIDVSVSPNDDINSMNVSVILEIINNEDPVSLNLVVERTR
jgi:predicted component of type VI protein secretion system|tara:strand:- start:3055 stop:3267 length:213 start_codon:yes stop_codon:yes gene_type:complete